MPTGVTGYTSKNVPYFDDTLQADNIGDGLVALANWITAHPGVSIETNTSRAALAGADLWVGKVIVNTDNGRLERCTGVGPPSTWAGVTVLTSTTDAQRDAFGVNDLWPGRAIFNTTSATIQIYDGSGWRQGTDAVPVMTTTARNALAGDDLWAGRSVYDSTLKALFIYDGAVWQPQGAAALIQAAGDLLQGSAANALSRLAAPSGGRHVLHLNPTTGLLEWDAINANYLFNPSFTRGFDGWFNGTINSPPDPTWQAVTDSANTGVPGAPVDNYAQNSDLGIQTLYSAPIPFPAGAGKNLTISFIGFGQPGGAGVQLRLFAYTDLLGTLGGTQIAATTALVNSWGAVSATGTTPAGTRSLRVSVFKGSASSGTAVASRIKLESGSVATPFCDDAPAPPWISVPGVVTGTGWTTPGGVIFNNYAYRMLDTKTMLLRLNIGFTGTNGSGALGVQLPNGVQAGAATQLLPGWFQPSGGSPRPAVGYVNGTTFLYPEIAFSTADNHYAAAESAGGVAPVNNDYFLCEGTIELQ